MFVKWKDGTYVNFGENLCNVLTVGYEWRLQNNYYVYITLIDGSTLFVEKFVDADEAKKCVEQTFNRLNSMVDGVQYPETRWFGE